MCMRMRVYNFIRIQIPNTPRKIMQKYPVTDDDFGFIYEKYLGVPRSGS